MDAADLTLIALEYSRQLAGSPRPALEVGERAYECVLRTDTHDVWLIHWGPGSGTPMHDHGRSAGVLSVVDGVLVERRPRRFRIGRVRQRVVRALEWRVMTPAHVHEIANESAVAATSVHVYSPPLDVMHHYEIERGALRVVHREPVPVGTGRVTFA
jgi:Cysteine dioxygenase type I